LSTPIIHHKSSIINSDGFTLIELLVVISIIALLMAVLLPTLGQVRKQARAVACQATLRQWGIVFSMYMNEHDDKFDASKANDVRWWLCSRAYYADCDNLLLCPMARRYQLNTNDPKWQENASVGYGMGSKLTAWKDGSSAHLLDRAIPLLGSYGANIDAIGTYSVQVQPYLQAPPRPARSSLPFLLDCSWMVSYARPHYEPPAYDGDLSFVANPGSSHIMKRVCIDRHGGGINSLFMDWSVRKVGLKELWILKWNGPYDTCGPWTKAGGVQSEDWPVWMRSVEDY
jgi:prepilin-type N-terminal cleavage/methylation domain-containing protein/prepilin-type processing-associated H-X9-DG protein